jgi:hypothetical protein
VRIYATRNSRQHDEVSDSEQPGSPDEDDDRRRAPRKLVAAAGQIETNEDEHAVLIRNISATGALLFTRKQLAVDEAFDMDIMLTSEDDTLQSSCHVVRCEELAVETRNWWRYRVAITFDEAMDEHAEAIDALAERARKNHG